MTQEQEEHWRPIEGFSTYVVSQNGRVKRLAFRDRVGRDRSERILRPLLIKHAKLFAEHRKSMGHYVRLKKETNGRFIHLSIADLVWAAFGDEPYDRRYQYLSFKNMNPCDCRLENLFLQHKHEDTYRGQVARKLATLKTLAMT